MMRRAIIEYPHNKGLHETWLIRDSEDLVEYFEMVSERAAKYLNRLITSQVNPNRWDHMISKTPEGIIMAATLNSCKVFGGSPILEYDNHMSRMHWSMIEHVIIRGTPLVVNNVGGYFPLDDESMVIKEWKHIPERVHTYHIAVDCKHINLENDDTLEQHTIEYMRKLGYKSHKEFSYICDLHQYNQSELTEIFNKFVKCGGEEVYVYTTGTNVQQMYDYSKAALDAGIRIFKFEFNSGTDESIEEFIKWLRAERTCHGEIPVCSITTLIRL